MYFSPLPCIIFTVVFSSHYLIKQLSSSDSAEKATRGVLSWWYHHQLINLQIKYQVMVISLRYTIVQLHCREHKQNQNDINTGDLLAVRPTNVRVL